MSTAEECSAEIDMRETAENDPCQSLRIVGFASHQPHAFREAVLSGFNIAALANRRFDITLDIYPTIARIFAELDKLDAFAKAAPPRQPDAA